MARSTPIVLLALAASVSCLTTCPGFPGFCSEAFPGNSCQVVCEAGRPNVPLCQADGTWTDIPRCVEHEPGVEEQIPGLCPGVSGYCSTGFLHGRCRFDCTTGRDINSVCSPDGTWSPYPTCEGDRRELRDGCDGCPGPQGGLRNRTAEATLSRNTVSDRRVPKTITGNGGRKNVPSFAGNINIGPIGDNIDRKPATRRPQQQQFQTSFNRQQQNTRQGANRQQNRPQQNNRQQQNNGQNNRQQSNNNRQQQQQFNNNNRQQQFNNNRQQQPNNNNRQQQQGAGRQQQNTRTQEPRRNPLFAEQFPEQQQQQAEEPRQAQQPQQPRRTQQPQPQDNSLSLFDRIKAKANGGNRQTSSPTSAPRQQAPRQQAPRQQAPRQQAPRQQSRRPGGQNFGVFESVDLGGPRSGPSPPAAPRQAAPRPRAPASRQREEDFFGEFQSVALQG